MVSSRTLAALLAAGSLGFGLAACNDRENEGQGNDGGTPGATTSENVTGNGNAPDAPKDGTPPSTVTGEQGLGAEPVTP